MRKNLLLFLLLFTLSIFIPSCNEPPTLQPSGSVEEQQDFSNSDEPMNSAEYVLTGRVTRVYDGDTFDLKTEEGDVRVRSFGIDAPESNQPYGTKSKRFLSDHILKKEIAVYVITKDHYGRTVGVAVLNGKDINYETLKAGYAWHYKRYDKTPSYAKYAKAEKDARAEKIGLWQDDAPIAPWVWRQKNKK